MLDSKATAFLTHRLSLTEPDFGQDWETKSADATRLGEFISFYEEGSQLKPAIKIALMTLILESYDNFACGDNISNSYYSRITILLKHELLLHRQLIESWQQIQQMRADSGFSLSISFPTTNLPLITNGSCSPEEYLALDQSDPWKNEYYDGVAYQMLQIPYRHQELRQHITELLRRRINRKWFDTLGSRMRLFVPEKQAYFFPDITIIDRNSVFQDDERYNLLNPVSLVEISSFNSKLYDSSVKATHYMTLPSLREYLRLDADALHVELYSRTATGQWTFTEILDPQGAVVLPGVDTSLTMIELYEDIELS